MTGHIASVIVAASIALGGLAAWAPDPMMGTADPPTTATPRDGCVTADCHPGVKAHRFLHGPVHVNACDSCHTLTDAAEHSFVAPREREETCAFCHLIEEPEGEFVHDPFAQGECLSCHDPHGSTESSMLRGKNYADSCGICHADATGAHEHVHGPVAAGACGACHEPHSAPHKGLLVLDGRDLCLRCHVTTGIELESMHSVHEPATGDCRVCHDSHASNVDGILHEDARALCTACHEDIARTIGQATTQHAAVTTEESCLNCHMPHASDHEVILRNNAMALCFECHDEEIELEGGRVLANMKAIIESGTSLHGPVAQSNCTACHEIHGGGHERLLTLEYPSSLYYPYQGNAYALCFSCHDRALVLVEEDHTVTGFRNGSLNLHFIHVNRDERGRSCRICHESHAANKEHYIRESIPYGPAGWELPIGYERTENGGTCNSGCHQPFAYDRVDPVEIERPESDGAWRGRDLVPGKTRNDGEEEDD